MNISVIGKYGSFAPFGGACSCYLLNIGSKNIVLDLGSGSLARLLDKISFDKIDAVMFSYLHSDHMTDLGIMGYAQDIWNKKNNSDVKLDVYLPGEPVETYEHIKLGNKFNFHVIKEGIFDVAGIKCSAFELAHPVIDFGYRFEYKNSVFVYTGDTRMHTNLKPLMQDADIVLCDSAFFNNEASDTAPHLSAFQAATAALDAMAKKLILTHIRPGSDEKMLLKEALSVFENTILAQEGETYSA